MTKRRKAQCVDFEQYAQLRNHSLITLEKVLDAADATHAEKIKAATTLLSYIERNQYRTARHLNRKT